MEIGVRRKRRVKMVDDVREYISPESERCRRNMVSNP